jgi:hypothetical protein
MAVLEELTPSRPLGSIEDSGTIMIRILVSAPAPTGFFPYRIDGHWGPGGAPLIGIAEDPIAEACRVLQALGVDLGTRIKIDAPHTRLGPIHASGLLGNFLKKVVAVLPPPPKALPPLAQRIADAAGFLEEPLKALPAPRRARRKALVVRGSGVPGDSF